MVVEIEVTSFWTNLREIGHGNLGMKWSVMGASIPIFMVVCLAYGRAQLKRSMGACSKSSLECVLNFLLLTSP